MIKNQWVIFSILLLGVFVALEANAFTTPALPYISADFGLAVQNSGLLSLLASGASIALSPLLGRLGDQVGRKRVIVIGLVIFIIAQFTKVFTAHLFVYLIAALLQGVGYAFIFSNVFAYIPELFTVEKRGKAIGLFMLFSYIATGTGGAIAGALIGEWGWRSVYLVSGVLSVIGFVLITICVPKSKKGQKSQLDYKGVAVFMTSITLLVGLPLIMSNFGFTWLMVGIGAFLVLIAIFLNMQKKEANPTLDLKLMKLKGVYIPCTLIAVQNFMMLSLLMSLTFLSADNPNVSALQVGLITTVLFTTAMVISPMIGVLLDRYNPVYLVYVSLLSGFIAIFLYLRIDTTSTLMQILTVMAFTGICSSFLNASLMKIVINFTPDHKKGVGTGIFTLFKDLGLPIGSTLGLTIYGVSTSRGFEETISGTAAELGLNAEQTTQLIASKTTGEIPAALEATLTQANLTFTELLTNATAQSVASGIQTLGIINLSLFVLLTLLSLGLLKLKSEKASESVPVLDQQAVLEEA